MYQWRVSILDNRGDIVEKIICSRSRYIIPFMYKSFANDNFDLVVKSIQEDAGWVIQDMYDEGAEQDLYSIILDGFMMGENQNNIGCAFSYICSENSKSILQFNYTRFKKEFIVSIIDMGLYLFRTGVGFLWYEAEVPKDATIAEKTLFQNEFKELTYERFVSLENKDRRYTFESVNHPKTPVLMGHWLDEIMKKMPFACEYFAKRKDPLNPSNMICDKALIFEYAVFDEMEQESLWNTIYWLTNGYNDRYKRKKDFAKEAIEPFNNAYCYATTAGCGYYVIPEESNTNFYLRIFKKKIMLDYFKIYILALYQDYTILKFTKDMEKELSAESQNYLENADTVLNVLKRLETEINVFLIKSVYSSVSHIDHQNTFYEYIIKKLRVKEDIEGLTIGLESLQKLQESRKKENLEEIERQENQEREISDDRLNIGLGLISILAVISAIADGFGTADALVGLFGLPELMKNIIEIAVLVIVTAIAVIALKSIMPSFKRSRKKRKELKKEGEK